MTDRYFSVQDQLLASLRLSYDQPPSEAACLRHAMDGSLKLLDAIYLAERIQDCRPRRILEVGSFLGLSTRWLLEVTNVFGSRVVSVDPGLRHRTFDDVRWHVRKFCQPFSDRLSLVSGCLSEKNELMFLHDYLRFEPRVEEQVARRRIRQVPVIAEPFGEFDFAFVDGDHSFRAVVLNILLVARMMPNGGLIVVHDALSWEEVVPALQALTSLTSDLRLEGVYGCSFCRAAEHVLHADPPRAQVARGEPRGGAPSAGAEAAIGAIGRPLCDGLAILRLGTSNALREIDASQILAPYSAPVCSDQLRLIEVRPAEARPVLGCCGELR